MHTISCLEDIDEEDKKPELIYPESILARILKRIPEDERQKTVLYLKQMDLVRYKYEMGLTRFLKTPLYDLV